MNYLGPFHSRKSRATPVRMTMTAFQSPPRIIFYRSLLSRTCSNSSLRFCLVTPTVVLQGLLHTTAENHQISTTENSCQATSMRAHEVYTTGLCFSVEPFCVVWWTVTVSFCSTSSLVCIWTRRQEQKAMFKQYGFNLQKSGSERHEFD